MSLPAAAGNPQLGLANPVNGECEAGCLLYHYHSRLLAKA